MTRSNTSAFTLLELVIVLAIAATLAAFAIPSYRSHIARAHRIDAASALYRAAQFVEGAPSDSATTTLPTGLDQAPHFGTAVYRLRVLSADDTNGGYAIEATPAQDGPMRDDACGTFTLDATGSRSNRNDGGGSTPANSECWNTG
ncbi:prepilin-type N-terminal cleavage/methylation domain-containing protein [Paraburkholderia sp. MMS20-SJTR3]|uniref:Prepilin-type N-terminal cleavage/methylation domain-containing protein n=1 Tax=Paraburkholderia sejongensis TaxID=2886946 RepID=A0ABS8JPS6_9BURK|nr:type IV pilin protein [Paraburkholderia sp. MMS20-SJTR3]MCC8391881.1 prepilin-type N-terminal cleavage/methylation domain-containing protein [Paraburkholderia sp. MMS20-SJTR3]